MVQAQEWLDKEYSQGNRKNITNLELRNKDLEGELLIKNWPNLED